ncbi:MAG: potassium channel protein [Thermodesulfobacteriota bacterium]|nr:potassium channel protein [Thermodesulfobacteriota bacterium]
MPKKLIFPIIIFIALILAGISGYMIIEGWDIFDAIYMTVITISSVGYQEVHETGPGGRIFTIILIVFGIFLITYIVGLVAEIFIEGEIRSILGRKKLDRKIQSLKNHYIICGYGRIGRTICNVLTKRSIPLIVIEKEEQARQELEQDKILYIDRDATHEDALIDAGVKRAKGLVSVVSSDPENVYITLTARGLNRELFILSRAEYSATKAKLLQAGANKVILPYDIGARRMAQAIIRPAVSDFIELAMHESSFELAIEEIVVGENSPFANLTLIESEIRKELDIIIIGIKKKDDRTIFNPSSQTMIQTGDLLIAMGSYENLERLRKLLIADS